MRLLGGVALAQGAVSKGQRGPVVFQHQRISRLTRAAAQVAELGQL